MGGVLGGYLFVVDIIGGAVLWVAIGSKAWREGGRVFRLGAGAMSIGAAIGIFVSVFASPTYAEPQWIVGAIAGSLTSLVLTFILYEISRAIDDPK
jgi:hypothetical protein